MCRHSCFGLSCARGTINLTVLFHHRPLWDAVSLSSRDFHFAHRIRAFIHQHASPHARFLQRTLFCSQLKPRSTWNRLEPLLSGHSSDTDPHLWLFRRRSSAVSGRPLSSRHWQRPDPPQHVAEQPPGQMTFRQEEPVVPCVLHQPASGFHQPLLETRERPALDSRRQDQSAPQVAQVVGQDAQLQAHFVRPEPMVRQPRPVRRCLPSLIHCSAVPRLL